MSHRDCITAAAARLRHAGHERRRAGGRHGGPRARPLRRAVPPRGRAHAARHGRAAQLPLQGLRLPPRPGRRPRSSRSRSAASARRSADDKAVLGLSGGVDSSVAALLVHRAIGDRLTCVFVDQGMMRMRTRPSTSSRRSPSTFGIPLVAVDASERFLDKLVGRHRARAQAQDHRRGVHPLLRGGGAQAHRRPVPRAGHALQRRDRERHARRRPRSRATTTSAACPRRWTSSWSSRCACCSRTRCAPSARSSGLPEHIVWRQPFPGPGLGIRIIGEITAERVDILQRADAILQEEIRKAGLYRELWQCFAILPVIRSVGVQGDERTYAYPIAIRAVTSDDAMTADWARLPYDLLETVSLAHHQRGARGQPRRLRRLEQAAEHDRVGVTALGLGRHAGDAASRTRPWAAFGSDGRRCPGRTEDQRPTATKTSAHVRSTMMMMVARSAIWRMRRAMKVGSRPRPDRSA